MKCCILIILIFFLIIIPGTLIPDTIRLHNGSQINGRIINATKKYVVINTEDSKIILLPHDQIKSISFSWADIVYNISGEKIICKIIDLSGTHLFIVTPEGSQQIPSADIKMYYYHASQNLEIPSLPATGAAFKNLKEFRPKGLKHRIVFGIQHSTHFFPYKEKRRLSNADWILGGTIKLGYFFTNTIFFGSRITYGKYESEYFKDLQSAYSSLNAYGSVEYNFDIEKSPRSYVYFGVDFGIITAKGNVIYTYLDPESEEDNPTYITDELTFIRRSPGYMPRVGFRTFVEKRFSAGIEIAFLFENSKSVTIPNEYMKDLATFFKGFYFSLNVLYYL